MCTGSKTESCTLEFNMEGEFQAKKDGNFSKSCSKLLELSAEDNIIGFLSEIVEKGCDANELSVWYGKRIGSKKMCFEERTPLLIAAIYGSIKVLKYIIETAKFDVNKAYGLDGVTALHCAASGGSELAVEIVEMLIEAGADINCVDANGFKPVDIVAISFKSLNNSKRKKLKMLLKGGIKTDVFDQKEEELKNAKAEFTVDETLPNINKGIYATDEFRMYSFKVTPCSRAYSHVWIDCPFVHPGENAKRRDPRKYNYTCVPCPEFKRGDCPKKDSCEYAHGVFESLLHPAQYRTRRCKDDTSCLRKVCFFAHKPEQLRPLYASTGSAMPSSPFSGSISSMDIGSVSPLALSSPMVPSMMSSSPMGTSMWQNNMSPPALQLPASRLQPNFSARDVDFETNMHSFESIHIQQHNMHQMLDEMSSPWDFNPININEGVLGSLDYNLQSPNGIQMLRNTSHPLRENYPCNIPSPFPSSRNSRLSPFGNGSKSFNHHASLTTVAPDSPTSKSSNLSDLGWVFNTDELSKLGKSESFGIKNGKDAFEMIPSLEEEPDVSWVRSLVKDSEKIGSILDKMPSWFDNLHLEQEQLVA